jgi:hypothetical protein
MSAAISGRLAIAQQVIWFQEPSRPMAHRENMDEFRFHDVQDSVGAEEHLTDFVTGCIRFGCQGMPSWPLLERVNCVEEA